MCNLLPPFPLTLFENFSYGKNPNLKSGSNIESEHGSIVLFLKNYLPAVEGNAGDLLTYQLCCRVVRDFGLSKNEALELLLEHWNPRCQPPWEVDALNEKLENALAYGNGPIAKENEPWNEIISLEDHLVPEFPRNIFPTEIEQFADQLSKAAEVPYDLVGMLLLAAISTASQGKYFIKVSSVFAEPNPLWVLAVLEPGNRKSYIFKTLFSPIFEYESKLQQEATPEIRKNGARIKSIEAQISALRKRIGADPGKDSDLFAQIDQLEISKPEKVFLPRIVVSDVTPEKLASVMAENDSTLSLLSDEGGFFENIGGRYSKGVPNFDLFLQSYSRSPVRVDRKNTLEPVQMNEPCLTIGATVQPAVLSKLSDRPEFKTIGLLSRFIYTIPRSPLGFRTGVEYEIEPKLLSSYSAMIENILTSSPINEVWTK
ncbi:MAG: hypothetical protein COT73_09685 [Bdellovibrio sp. CG10_big_fil_rev_8_21_14_0_10_47_8]|nr:MAG: hypothetical protein COT73_09685 [Bdellovibrio sp. CG10_big_fil_rev_8_21_14_0_10_47_8]